MRVAAALLVLGTGAACGTVFETKKIPLVLLGEVPVPEQTKVAAGAERPMGSNSGVGLWWLSFEANAADAMFDSTENAKDPDIYYEGHEERLTINFLLAFYERSRFVARPMRLQTHALPVAKGKAP